MAKLTLDDILGGYATVATLNANNALIEAALENTVSRDGTTPNSMGADFDMNSYNVNNVNTLNASSAVLTELTLGGVAITPTTTLSGGLAASEVTYDASDLNTKLNTEFLKNNENGTLTGTLGVTGLLTAQAGLTVSTGNLDVTAGNITLSGTVNGIDVTEAVLKSITASGLLRAGTWLHGDGTTTAYSGIGSALPSLSPLPFDDTYATIGPTGSGADYIWSALDNRPAGTTGYLLRCDLRLHGDGSTASGIFISLANPDSGTPLVNSVQLCGLASGGGLDMSANHLTPVPCNASGVIKLARGVTASVTPDTVSCTFRLQGFIED